MRRMEENYVKGLEKILSHLYCGERFYLMYTYPQTFHQTVNLLNVCGFYTSTLHE